MGKRLSIVLHGKCATLASVRDAVKLMRDLGHDVSVRVTWEPGDAKRLTEEAIDAGYGTVIAGGGDGTINEVVQGLATVDRSDRPALGILPLGTANDFATSAGIPLEPVDALELIVDAKPTAVDIAWLNDQPFLNVATGGMGVQVTTQTPESLKKALGAAAYFITGMTKFNTLQPVHVDLVNDHFNWSGDILLIALGNGRQAGGGNLLCHHALINDGLIEVGVMPAEGEGDFTKALGAIINGGMPEDDSVVTAQVARLSITAPDGLHVNLDGEPIKATAFDLRLEPGAVRLHLPAQCPLLQA